MTSPDGRVAGKPQPEPSELLFAYDSAPAFEEAVSFGGSETCRGSDGVEVFRWSSSNRSLGELAGGFARLRACAAAAAAHPAFVAAHPSCEPGFTEASYRAALAHYEYADYLTGDFAGDAGGEK